MKTNQVELSEKDQKLFAEMQKHYTSENERIFFEMLKYKEQYILADEWDILMNDSNNDEHILFYRDSYDWYMIERKDVEHYYIEEFYTLADALNAHVSKWGVGEGTFLDWLRRRDYKGINYNHKQ